MSPLAGVGITPSGQPLAGAMSTVGISEVTGSGSVGFGPTVASSGSLALSLQAERTEAAPGRAVRAPRVGLYQPWNGSMDEGWSRWVLEQYGFSPIAVHPEDFKSPLAQKIDLK